MSVPDYQSLMLPLLEFLADGSEHEVTEARDKIATRFHLSPDDRALLIPSGRQPVFDNRLGWAKTYLAKAGLVSSPRRGVYQITERGRELLRTHSTRIDNEVLMHIPEFAEFFRRRGDGGSEARAEIAAEAVTTSATPRETLEDSYQLIRRQIESDLLANVLNASAAFFERLVVKLLVAMGYGGSLKDAGQRIGRSGDDGVDGIIKEDRLGLDVIYLQAKKWKPDRKIGRPDVQAFAGSLEGVRAKKGVFLTTSRFTEEASDYVQRIEKRIVLIDGARLASLMFDFNIGVSPEATYEIKRIDTDYFSEEDDA